MAEQAQVKSVDELQALRAAFVIYQTKSRRAVDMALEEALRLRQWLEGDCRLHWEAQIRQWTKKLEQAKAEFLTARLSSLVERATRQQEAVRQAERALAHAHEKLKTARRWARDFETAAGPHVRRLENVRDTFVHQMPKAVAWLHQAILTLEAYAESHPSSGAGTTAPTSLPEAPPAAESSTGSPPFLSSESTP